MRLLLASLAGACAIASAAGPLAAEPLLNNFGAVAISPDGSRVVSVETTQPAPESTSMPKTKIVVWPVTAGAPATIACSTPAPCTLSAPVWSPDGSRVAYLERNAKTRLFSVRVAAADGRSTRVWLANFRGVLNALRWAPDGTSLGLLATAGAHKDIGATQAGAALTGDIGAELSEDVQRIAVLDARGTLQYVSPVDLFIYEYDWMPDGSGFAATGANGNGDDNWWIAKLYTISRANGTATAIYSPPLQINWPRVSPDGKTIAFISGIMSDFGPVGGDVYTVPVDGGVATDVTPGIAASPNALAWLGRSDRITFTALAGDDAALESVDLGTGHITSEWSAPEGITADANLRISFSRSGAASAVAIQTFERPPEIYAGAVGAWKPLTHENAALVPATHATSVHWTDDGFNVQGWLLAPLTVTAGKTYPLIVQVHGGPSAAATPFYIGRGTSKTLLEHGYYLFFPNPRGSYGQGERFTAANVRDFGYGDLRDILTGIDAAERVAPIDEKRLGITGFSYGGYMTMWAVTQTQRFKAAVAGAGVADWLSYAGENGIDRWMDPFFGASIYDDPAVYARSAPMTFIKHVKTPTFVFVGERDVECPAPQSLEFWHALRWLGVPTDLVIYPGEGHGLRMPAHSKDAEKRTLAWFDKYLGGP